MIGLDGRVVVVTGAVGSLGSATARTLQAGGARTVLVDRSQERLRRAYPGLAEADGHLLAGDVDLSEPRAVAGMVQRALQRFGRIDGLVHTVGGYRGGKTVVEEDPDTWTLLFDLNVRTAVNVCRAVTPAMVAQASGSIVTVASHDARSGRAGHAAYSAAKAGVARLSESLAAELAGSGVRVNCVLPGTLATEANRTALGTAAGLPPGDVALVIAFLISDAARAVSGTNLLVGLHA
jgi:NAD(P)-dependent dehydrogenase (short-subunit alcohol dehydrogenase family)